MVELSFIVALESVVTKIKKKSMVAVSVSFQFVSNLDYRIEYRPDLAKVTYSDYLNEYYLIKWWKEALEYYSMKLPRRFVITHTLSIDYKTTGFKFNWI